MTEYKNSASNTYLPDADVPKASPHKCPALSNPNAGHRQRMKKRFLHDAAVMEDYEILEMTLGYAQARRDTRVLAKELLHRFDTMEGVMGATPEALMCTPGMGAGLTLFCRLLRECQIRCAQSPRRKYQPLKTTPEIMDFVKMRLSSCAHEEVWLGTLNRGRHLIGWECLHKGTVTSSELSLRELMKTVLQHKAVGFFLVHNHPGGNLSPSARDLETTYKVSKVAHTLGINFEDHIIVTADACYSFKQEGRLPPI